MFDKVDTPFTYGRLISSGIFQDKGKYPVS